MTATAPFCLNGSVEIDGLSLARLSFKERAACTGRIACDPGSRSMSALRFALLGSYARQPRFGPYRAEDWKRASQALEQMHAGHLAGRFLEELSSGERQKVSIAQVLVQNPACLFLDEPSSSLDPKARFELMDLLESLRSEERILLVVVHDLDLALRYGDEILVLDQGKTVFWGTAEQFASSTISEQVFQVRIADWDPTTRTARIFPVSEKKVSVEKRYDKDL